VSGRRFIPAALVAVAAMALLIPGVAGAPQQNKTVPAPAAGSTPNPGAGPSNQAELRIEGEKRFQAHCGRCHQSPHKFPPRMVMTIERHMRVRATLTDQDMRLIVGYLLQ
jgi:mono/diheme cytochrome c family protein